MADDINVKESVEYDNFIGKTEVKKSKLSELFDIEEEEDLREWEKHWKGMPEFKNEENPAYKVINIRFRNEEDYKKFADLIEQNLTEKTKSIWYPALDRFENSLLRWIEEE